MAVNRDHVSFIGREPGVGEAAPELNSPHSQGDSAELAPESSVNAHLEDPADESDGRSLRAQARRELRRNTILVAATRVFKDKGYHAASVHDIIDAAQIARGTFYLYFPSKSEVFAELATTFLQLIRGSVQKISLDPEAGEPLAQMRANFRRVMSTVLDHADLAAIMLRHEGDAEARAQLDRFYRQVTDLIGQAVRVGTTLGFARDCNVEVIAVAALAGLKEALGRMLGARDEKARRAEEPRVEVVGDLQRTAVQTRPAGGPGRVWDADPWQMEPAQLADELLTFFVRGVFTQAEG